MHLDLRATQWISDNRSATIGVSLPAAIVGMLPLDSIVITVVLEMALPVESMVACLVFRQVLLRPEELGFTDELSIVLTTVIPHHFEETQHELHAQT